MRFKTFPYVRIAYKSGVFFFSYIHPWRLLRASFPPSPTHRGPPLLRRLRRRRKRPTGVIALYYITCNTRSEEKEGSDSTSKQSFSKEQEQNCKNQKMGLYSEVFLPTRCKTTTKTTKRRRRRGGGGGGGLNHKLQAVNWVAISFMISLLMVLQILVVRTEGIQIAAGAGAGGGGGGRGGTVMKLKHRMAEQEDGFQSFDKSARQEGGGGRGEGGGMSVEHYKRLRSHDEARRFNSFQKTSSRIRGSRETLEVVDLDLYGHYLTDGLYYMEIMLGTPSQTYYAIVDTGSDLLWVDCNPCTGCPQNSSLQVPLTPYSESASSSNQAVGCSDTFCSSVSSEGLATSCGGGSSCEFASGYGDGSTVSGYIVSDLFSYNAISNLTNSTERMSTRVSFGCGNNRTGNLASSQSATNGLIGFGQQSISVISQLAADRTIPNTFAHCLQGETGTSSLVIGEITEPGITYTSMVPNQRHYTANLFNIAVHGTNISSSAVLTSSSGSNLQVIFDSGTTLATLMDPFFSNFVNAIEASVTIPVQIRQNTPCYITSGSSSTSLFPNVTLYFEGGAMELGPDSYLLPIQDGDILYYCIAWSASSGDTVAISILGDIVLQNQIIVYDNELEQVGWKPFNCSQTISASFTQNGPSVAQSSSASGVGKSSHNSSKTLRTYISFTAILYILGYIIIITI